MRAAKFERLTSVVQERALIVDDLTRSGRRPAEQAAGASGFVLELWDALRDAIAAIAARLPVAGTGRWPA